MELKLDLYGHLVRAGIIEGGRSNPAHKIFLDQKIAQLDKETTLVFENAIAFARYLIYIKRRIESIEEETGIKKGSKLIDEGRLMELKASIAAPQRLFNWNIVIKELQKLSIKIDGDLKSLLVAGDHAIIADMLKTLFRSEMQLIRSARPPSPGGEGGDEEIKQPVPADVEIQ